MGFDRFAVALGYWAYMVLWNVGGVTERDHVRDRRLPSGQMDTISAQLHRIGFRPAMGQGGDPEEWGEEDEAAAEVYWGLVARYEGIEHVPAERRADIEASV